MTFEPSLPQIMPDTANLVQGVITGSVCEAPPSDAEITPLLNKHKVGQSCPKMDGPGKICRLMHLCKLGSFHYLFTRERLLLALLYHQISPPSSCSVSTHLPFSLLRPFNQLGIQRTTSTGCFRPSLTNGARLSASPGIPIRGRWDQSQPRWPAELDILCTGMTSITAIVLMARHVNLMLTYS